MFIFSYYILMVISIELIWTYPMTSGLSGSSLSAPEVEVLASVPGDTLSFIHLYVSVLDSVQVNQRQWAKPNSKVRVSLYNKSETHKIKAFFFFFLLENQFRRHKHPPSFNPKDIWT